MNSCGAIDTSSLDILASICMNELKNNNIPNKTLPKNDINREISIGYIKNLNDKISQINNPSLNYNDKLKTVMNNMGPIEQVLMNAFVLPTRYVKK